VLAGQSWGAILVQLLAYRRPELVAGLVLVDPAVEQMASPVLLPLRWALRTALPRHVDELSSTDTDTAMRALRKLRATRPLTDVPVVVLSADLGRPRWARRYFTSLQAQLAEGNPRGRHAVVSGAGHDIPEESPGIVAAAILEVATQARAGCR
jgi:pimeloyl-ACP methyl ester carboxylesterase